MGCIAGVTAGQTREWLLEAAAGATPDLNAVGEAEWAALPARVASAFSPDGITAQTGAAQ